jgi:hypothetical protein
MIMKIWAAKKRGEMKALGATELAEMFELVVRICALDEKLTSTRNKVLSKKVPKLRCKTSA